jgi:flagellar biosynthesis/type III secretory pathway protein FliH
MKYTVSVNEKSKVITVTLADGTVGTAKCCESDSFNLAVGIELALERAKVAKANAEKPKVTKSGDVMELVKALEKALPKGQVVVVGSGEGLTANQKAWLHSLTDCKGGCSCECSCDKDCEECEYQYTEDDMDKAVEDAYDEGYADGERQANADHEQSVSDAYDEGYADAVREMKNALADLG